MPINDLNISNSDIVAGQKVFASQALARIAEIEAWANAEVADKAMDLDSAQVITAEKDFSGGDRCKVKTQTAGNDTNQAASTAFVAAAVAAAVSLSALTLEDADAAAMIKGVTYTAASDGFVTAYVKMTTTNDLLEGLIGGSAVMRSEVSGNDWASISFSVASGETFKINATTGTPSIRWRSMGTLSKPIK